MSTTDIVSVGNTSPEVPGRAPRKGRSFPFLAIPLVLVNVGAVSGQAGWGYNHIAGELADGADQYIRIILAIAFAAAIESIGVYLSHEAHLARMANQSAGMLQIAAYGVGLGAAWLNYEHFRTPADDNNVVAVTFAAMSLISPWLWAVWSRARNRNRLAAMGDMDTKAPRLSTARKFLHPVKSFKVLRWSVWEGISTPAEAVMAWEMRERADAPVSPAPAGSSGEVPGGKKTTEERLAEYRRIKEELPEITRERAAELMGISTRHLRNVLNGKTGELPVVGKVEK